MNKEQPVITTQDLTRRFGDTIAVKELTLEVYQGEIFGFLGHNGAGKTTTVRLLNGVLNNNGGQAKVLGMDPQKDGAALRLHTGVLTETPALDDQLTAREQLSLYAQIYNVPEAEISQRVERMLEDFELGERGDEPVGGYSKGMRQRLALARTLIHKPKLIFLDEPTSGLDPVATRQVHELIQDLSHNNGHTVFLCTHNLEEAQKLCDRVAVLEHGQLMALGAPRELAQNLWKGVRLEIELAKLGATEAVAALGSLPYMRDVEWHDTNNTATVWLPDREFIPEVVNTLVTAGGRLYQLKLQEPTLEDVYFAIHEDQGATVKNMDNALKKAALKKVLSTVDGGVL
ncbi:MAG: ABC transporter ATP-binding protein [Anaerolineae bacterium]|nr:ABC transporter ATP-binding protein [Anaerolineae bacterium]